MVQRIVTGVVLIGVLVTALTFGGWFFSIPFMICIGISMFEMFKALKASGARLVEWPVYACFVASIPIMTFKLGSSAALLPLVGAAVMLIAVQVMFRKEPELTDILLSALPLTFVLLPGMCMLGLSRAPNAQVELMLKIMAFAIPLAGDTFAYFIGIIWGRHKLIEPVSPHKTVEGAVGGLFGSILCSFIVWAVFSSAGIMPFWHALLLGVICGLSGQAGDLFASLIKRHCGVKDYGSVFPGHGGIMDQLDSVYWAVVVVYVYLIWFF
ncbi:MAG: phosphatidate cytidylyltransferase [Clostridia bacterium]|nr:phosphatidate cytidylyltransferase [Clostridia bacterium]